VTNDGTALEADGVSSRFGVKDEDRRNVPPRAPIDRDRYKLSIVIPCYNEALTIATLLARIGRARVPRKEVIVVDDGSTDGTPGLLGGDLAPAIDRLIILPRNGGKGAALRAGFAKATGDIVLVQDADLEYDPADYGRLIAPILEQGADVVYGSRFVGSGQHRVLLFWHRVANRVLTLLSNCCTNLNLTDMETGYKVFRRDVIQAVELREDRFGFDPEVTAKLAKAGCVFYEVGIGYHGRTYAEGKKIGARDALRALFAIFRYSLAAPPNGTAQGRRGSGLRCAHDVPVETCAHLDRS